MHIYYGFSLRSQSQEQSKKAVQFQQDDADAPFLILSNGSGIFESI